MLLGKNVASKQQFIDALTQEQKDLFGDSIDGIYDDYTHSNNRLTLQEFVNERLEVRMAMRKMAKILDKPEVMAVFKRLKNR